MTSKKNRVAASSVQEVAPAVRELGVDQFVIEAVLDSYLQKLTKTNVVMAEHVMSLMEADLKFTEQVNKAVLDGLLFSTFVGALEDDAYEVALEELQAFDDAVVAGIRREIFDYGVFIACQAIGGSATHGRTLKRVNLFKDRVSSIDVAP